MHHRSLAVSLFVTAALFSPCEAACPRFTAVMSSDAGPTMRLVGRLARCTRATHYFPQTCVARFRCVGTACPKDLGKAVFSFPWGGVLLPRGRTVADGGPKCQLPPVYPYPSNRDAYSGPYTCFASGGTPDTTGPQIDAGTIDVRVTERTFQFLRGYGRNPCRRAARR